MIDVRQLRRGGRVGVACSQLAAVAAAGLRGAEHGGGQGLLVSGLQSHEGRGREGEVRGGEWRRVRVGRRGRVVLSHTDQTVLSVSGGMVERTGGLQQVRHRKSHQVIICLVSPVPQSPPFPP